MSRIGTWASIVALARFKPWLFVGSGLLVGGAFYALPLLPAFFASQFIDSLSRNATPGLNLWMPLALLAGAGVVRGAIVVVGAAAEQALQHVLGTLMRRNVLEHILRQPGAQSLPASAGEAIARLRDDVHAVGFGLSWMLDPLGQLVVAALTVAVLVRIDPLLTLAVLSPLAVVVLIVRIAGTRVRHFRAAAQQSIGDVTGLLGEIFGAAMSIKVADAEEHVVAHLRRVNEARRRATLADRVFARFVSSAAKNIANVGTGLLLLLAASSMREGRFTVGDFALFVSYVASLTMIASQFGQFVTNFRQMDVSLHRLQVLLDGAAPGALVAHAPIFLLGPLPESAALPTESEEPLRELVAEDLSFQYPGSDRGIERISFALARGSFTVVTGRIGSGKTTLLRVLLGLLPMRSGSLFWNGQRVVDPAGVFVPPRTAYTPQAPRLVSESLRDNILLGVPEHTVDLDRVMHAAVLELDLPDLEDGLDTLVGPRGIKLSGGQVQRVAAARMFARPSELLVVDDLSSALDVQTERVLWERLLQRRDLTCLAVSHRHAALRRADQILLMSGGQLIDHGTLAELLQRSEEMRQLWSTSVSS
ncbi:MAG TPA: ABC transporter ATP-binding protein [Chloroflexota bacterium]